MESESMNNEFATIEYASAASPISPELLTVAKKLCGMSALCGPCVAVCFSPLLLGQTAGAGLHLAVFAATIAQAIFTGLSMQKLTQEPFISRRNAADALALIALSLFAIAPIVTVNYRHEGMLSVWMSTVFGLLALTSWRHVLLYRRLADYCRVAELIHMARAMLILGWFKAIYESLWLGACFATAFIMLMPHLGMYRRSPEDAAIIPAFGAFFGCIGFGGVWIWMVIAHGVLYSRLRRFAVTSSPEHAFPMMSSNQPPMASAALATNGHVEVLDH